MEPQIHFKHPNEGLGKGGRAAKGCGSGGWIDGCAGAGAEAGGVVGPGAEFGGYPPHPAPGKGLWVQVASGCEEMVIRGKNIVPAAVGVRVVLCM